MEDTLKKFVDKYRPCISIFTISLNGSCPVEYTNSLVSTMQLCDQYNIMVRVEFHKQYSNLQHAKNNFLCRNAEDDEVTHLMFIDSNMSWNPNDVINMLLDDKHIVAGACPQSYYSWDSVEKEPSLLQNVVEKRNEEPMLQHISLQKLIQSKLTRYSVVIGTEEAVMDNNLLQVHQVSFQFIMMKKIVVQKMMQAFPSTKYLVRDHYIHCLMDSIVESNSYYSDEEVFLKRWYHMKGKVYVNMLVVVDHMHTNRFQGSLMASLAL
jgi:hypothetical protein